MGTFHYLLAAYAALSSLVWVWGFGFILKQLFAAPHVSKVSAPEPETYPSLSILVPACNESDSIEPALRSLLEQDYPDMQVIAIDDRSTDNTGEIIDRLAEEYDNLRPLHITNLPENWIGKTHALKKGYEQSEGEWVLATDADVCYKAGALRSIMSVALYEDLDQISCLPDMRNSGFLHEVAYNGFVSFVVGVQNLNGIRNVDSDDYFAFGAFNMFRREVFDRTKGFEWLRMEIADDMGTARMMKDHGARQGFYFAFDQISLEWYGSLKRMISGLEKNGIAVMGHFRYLRGFGIPILWLLHMLGPLAGLFSSLLPVQIMALTAIFGSIPFNSMAAHRLRRPVHTFLFSPLGVCFIMYALVRSSIACARRGGVEWSGVVYPLEKLREYQRVKF